MALFGMAHDLLKVCNIAVRYTSWLVVGILLIYLSSGVAVVGSQTKAWHAIDLIPNLSCLA